MTGMREDLERKLHHQQPRRVDYSRPGFVRPDDPTCRTCEGAGVVDTTPEGARHPAMQSDTTCPTCDGTGERSTA